MADTTKLFETTVNTLIENIRQLNLAAKNLAVCEDVQQEDNFTECYWRGTAGMVLTKQLLTESGFDVKMKAGTTQTAKITGRIFSTIESLSIDGQNYRL